MELDADLDPDLYCIQILFANPKRTVYSIDKHETIFLILRCTGTST